MREDQRLDKPQWGESGRFHARRKSAISAAEQLDEAPRKCDFCEQDAVIDDRGAWFCELCFQSPAKLETSP